MRLNHLLAALLVLTLIQVSATATNCYVATTGNDDTGNGTIQSPYRTIGMGIGACSDGGTVFVMPGTYEENLYIYDWTVTIQAAQPRANGAVLIAGAYGQNTINPDTASLTLIGVDVTSYSGDDLINGLYSSITVERCRLYNSNGGGTGVRVDTGCTAIIRNSEISSCEFGVIVGDYATATVTNCTIVKNSLCGIYSSDYAYNATIINCILWGNSDDLDACTATYSCIENGDPGTCNISGYPYFADMAADDYHLTANSPCVDKGDPCLSYSGQDIYGGDRLVGSSADMGADEFLYMSTNLVPNSGFESGLAGWTLTNGGSAALDTSFRYLGTNSLRLTNDANAWCGVRESAFIPVEALQTYRLSAWCKTSAPGASVRIGFEQYDSSQTLLASSWNEVIGDHTAFVEGWTHLTGTRAVRAGTAFARVRIFGPDKFGSGGNAWWDDIDFRVECPDTICYGPQNVTDVAETVDFGGDPENTSWTNYLAHVIWNDPYSPLIMSSVSIDGCGYRSINANGILEVQFPEFNTDANGFPETPMMLEVMYKDVYTASSGDDASNCPMITSKMKYDDLDSEYLLTNIYFYYEVGYLGGTGDGKWKHVQVPFAKSDYPLLRGIGGKFTIRIDCRGTAQPIDYITLRTITEDEYQSFVKRQRDTEGFFELEPVDLASQLPNDNPAVFVRDMMHPIYRQTVPAQTEILGQTGEVNLKTAWGLTEPISVGIYSEGGAGGITLSASNLTRQGGTETISSSHVKICKSVSDYSRLEVGPWTCSYAFVPTRVEPLTGSLSVAAGTSQGVWIKVAVPQASENLPAGVYSGTITVSQNSVVKTTISLNINVISTTLLHSEQTNPMYWDPFCMIYSNDLDTALDTFREAEVEPFLWIVATGYDYGGKLFSIRAAYDNQNPPQPILDSAGLPEYDANNFNAMLSRMHDKGITASQMHLLVDERKAKEIYKAVTGSDLSMTDPCLYARLSETNFVAAFKKLIEAYQTAGSTYGITFIFHVADEPGTDARRRITCDRLFTYIRDCNGLTGCTYYTSCDQALTGAALGSYSVPNNSLPALTNLVDRKIWPYHYFDIGQQSSYGTFSYYTTDVAHMPDPVYNRFHHGLLAFATGAKDVAAYAMKQYIGDPYNAFDPGPCSSSYAWHDYALAYPTARGEILPAIGGLEGIREGIKDARYIATLKDLIAQHPSNAAAGAASGYLDRLKARISHNYKADYILKADDAGYAREIFRQVSLTGDPQDYGAFTQIRNTIIAYIQMVENSSLTGIWNETTNTWYSTIQSAIDQANTGDVIVVFPGTYTGTGNRNISFGGKAITLTSANPADPCVVAATTINCQSSGGAMYRCFYFHNSETAASVLTGFTITGGYMKNNDGAAILCAGASPTISNCVITSNCVKWGSGAGIANRDGAHTTIVGCTFTSNYAIHQGGGAVYNGNDSQVTISRCKFQQNHAPTGAGIFNKGCDTGSGVTIKNSVFAANYSPTKGVAIRNDASKVAVTNCTFTSHGSEHVMVSCNGSPVTVTNSIFWDNITKPKEISGNCGNQTTVTYSDVKNGFTARCNVIGSNNIDANPAFTAYTYYLSSSSPCIDVGDSNGNYTGQTDLRGRSRVVDIAGKGDGNNDVDMGADEYQP